MQEKTRTQTERNDFIMSRMSNASIAKQIQMLQEKKAENDNALFQTFIDALSNSENKKQLILITRKQLITI